MNKQKSWFWMDVRFALVLLLGVLLLSACGSRPRVGALRNESQSVELGDAKSVRVRINIGAGDLRLTGGAEKLLEADFTYNVALLKPKVEYTDGTLVVRQPEVGGMPVLRNITDFRNEWDLRLYDAVPMDLSVDVGGGVSDLQLAGLSLTGLDVTLGIGESTIDLSGDWARDLDITIDAGAAGLTLRLPSRCGCARGGGSRSNRDQCPGPGTGWRCLHQRSLWRVRCDTKHPRGGRYRLAESGIGR